MQRDRTDPRPRKLPRHAKMVQHTRRVWAHLNSRPNVAQRLGTLVHVHLKIRAQQ
jgi:hypothetical protein